MTSVAAAAAVAGLVASVALGDARPPVLKAGNPAGIVFAHGQGHGHGGSGGSSPDLTWHGGPVMSAGTQVTPILWGDWSQLSTVQNAIDSFYGGVSGSAYIKTTTEYTGPGGNPVSSSVTVTGDVPATAPTTHKAPSTSDVLAVVAATVPNPTPGGYYPVYSDQPRGHSGYCAWHSAGTVNGVPVEFAFFFNLTNDPGCTPSPLDVTPPSPAAEAIVNVSGHELSETLTDPQLNAWYDNTGAENADKCAWKFSGTPVTIGSEQWQIQGNWSNNSYDKNSPPSYLSGTGCVDGNQH